jgi:hypothetical protein
MTDYPKSLPCPTISEYKGIVDFGLLAVKFNRGNTRRRRMAANRLETYDLTFAYNAQQLWLFQTWANMFGYDWHYMPIVTHYSGFVNPQSVLLHRVRITSDIVTTALSADLFRVRVSIEVDTNSRPFGIIVPSGNWIIANTPVAPSSPDWIIAQTPSAPSTNTISAGTPVLPAA